MTVEAIARAGYEAWSGQRWAERPSSAVDAVWTAIATEIVDDEHPMPPIAFFVHWMYWLAHEVDVELIPPMWEAMDGDERGRWQRAARAMNETARELSAPVTA